MIGQNRENTGPIGENIACRFISAKKFKIISRNYRTKYGEIDIIAAEKKTGKIVFFEVKTIKIEEGEEASEKIAPEDNLTKAKMAKLKNVCQNFYLGNQELFRDDQGWRIDLLALTIRNKNCVIKHYENIVSW